jgi:2-hydroxy-3-keto-5-methylthiopentenyl-1-phosphate phosphatase
VRCCAKKKEEELHKQFMLDALGDSEHMMLNQKVQSMALQIVDYILKTLHPCPSPKSMKEVMEKVLSHPRLNHCLLDNVLHAHLAIAQ